jgi:FkbM family methyltransferase
MDVAPRDIPPPGAVGRVQRAFRRAARKLLPARWLTVPGLRSLLGVGCNHGHVLDRVDQLAVEYSLDSLIGQLLFLHGEFEKPEAEFICRRLRELPGTAMLDVGANIGLHSLRAARQSWNGRIYAFEPGRATFGMLARNIVRNNLTETIVACPLAVGAGAGRAQFHFCADDAYSSLVPDGRRPVCETYEVEVVGLDGWLATAAVGPVGFIKIDVEGGEADVITGAEETLRRHRPELLVEIYEGTRRDFSAEAFVRRIRAFGYEAFVLRAGEPVAFVRHDDEHYNYFFRPKN